MKISQLRKSEFFRNSSYMMSSTVLSQLLVIASFFVLSYVFTPEDIGLQGAFKSVVLVGAVILSFRMDAAIPLPKTDAVSESVFRKVIRFTLLVGGGVFLLLLGLDLCFSGGILHYVFDIDRSNGFYYILFLCICVGSIVFSLTTTYTARLISLNLFRKIAVSKLVQPFFALVIAIVGYYLAVKNIIIYAEVLSYVIFLIALVYFLPGQRAHDDSLTGREILSRYRNIPLYTFPTTLVNTIALNIPLLMLGSLYSMADVGYYSFAHRFTTLPTYFISATFSQLILKKLVDTYNQAPDSFYPTVKTTAKYLSLAAVVMFAAVFFLAPPVIHFLFQDKWDDSITLIRYLCFAQFFTLLNNSLVNIFIILNKQQFMLYHQLLFLLVRSFFLWYMWHLGYGLSESILVFAIIGVIFNAVLFGYIFWISAKVKCGK